jgi:hypothetical protein
LPYFLGAIRAKILFAGRNPEALAGDMLPIRNPGHFAIRSGLFLVVAAAVVGDFEDFVSEVLYPRWPPLGCC